MTRFLLISMVLVGQAFSAHAGLKDIISKKVREERKARDPLGLREEEAGKRLEEVLKSFKEDEKQRDLMIEEETRKLAQWLRAASEDPTHGVSQPTPPSEELREFIDFMAVTHVQLSKVYAKTHAEVDASNLTGKFGFIVGGALPGLVWAVLHAFGTGDLPSAFAMAYTILGGATVGYGTSKLAYRREDKALKDPAKLKMLPSGSIAGSQVAKSELGKLERILEVFYATLKNELPAEVPAEFESRIIADIRLRLEAFGDCSLAFSDENYPSLELFKRLQSAPAPRALPSGKKS